LVILGACGKIFTVLLYSYKFEVLEVKYSVIIPVFNEEDSVEPLFNSLKQSMTSLGEEYEIIFINDGSTDETLNRLNVLKDTSPNLRIVNFEENRGQGKAIEEGFRNSKGEIILTLDGDLQNDPQDIPKMVAKIDEGYDLVCGWRHNRKDNLIKKLKSKIGNFLQRKITKLGLHDMSCTFRAYRKNIVDNISLSGKYDFSLLPYVISQSHKVRIGEVKVRHNDRKFGATKYNALNTVLGTVYSYSQLVLKFKGSQKFKKKILKNNF